MRRCQRPVVASSRAASHDSGREAGCLAVGATGSGSCVPAWLPERSFGMEPAAGAPRPGPVPIHVLRPAGMRRERTRPQLAAVHDRRVRGRSRRSLRPAGDRPAGRGRAQSRIRDHPEGRARSSRPFRRGCACRTRFDDEARLPARRGEFRGPRPPGNNSWRWPAQPSAGSRPTKISGSSPGCSDRRRRSTSRAQPVRCGRLPAKRSLLLSICRQS